MNHNFPPVNNIAGFARNFYSLLCHDLKGMSILLGIFLKKQGGSLIVCARRGAAGRRREHGYPPTADRWSLRFAQTPMPKIAMDAGTDAGHNDCLSFCEAKTQS
jgi:hypothetical protein